MKTKLIKLIDDFHPLPYGRYNDDCPTCNETSGQAFRENILVPALEEYEKVIIDLNGTNRYDRSFLDEAFGGLISPNFSKTEFTNKIEIKHNVEMILDIITDRVDAAQKRLAK